MIAFILKLSLYLKYESLKQAANKTDCKETK